MIHPSLTLIIPNARLVREGTLEPARADHDPFLVEAIGREGARAYLHGPETMALYLPWPSKKIREMPHVRIHQQGDRECTLIMPIRYAKAPLQAAGILVRGFNG
jgi:hypothetical protein